MYISMEQWKINHSFETNANEILLQWVEYTGILDLYTGIEDRPLGSWYISQGRHHHHHDPTNNSDKHFALFSLTSFLWGRKCRRIRGSKNLSIFTTFKLEVRQLAKLDKNINIRVKSLESWRGNQDLRTQCLRRGNKWRCELTFCHSSFS